MKDKRNNLLRAPIDSLKQLIVSCGWIYHTADAEGIVIPTGFMIIQVSKGAKGIRWSLSADDCDKSRNYHMLQQLVDSYPATRNLESGVPQYLAFIAAD